MTSPTVWSGLQQVAQGAVEVEHVAVYAGRPSLTAQVVAALEVGGMTWVARSVIPTWSAEIALAHVRDRAPGRAARAWLVRKVQPGPAPRPRPDHGRQRTGWAPMVRESAGAMAVRPS